MKNKEYISPETCTLETISEGLLCISGFAPDSDNTPLIFEAQDNS